MTPTDTISTQEGLGIRPKGLMDIKQCYQDLIPLRSAEQSSGMELPSEQLCVQDAISR